MIVRRASLFLVCGLLGACRGDPQRQTRAPAPEVDDDGSEEGDVEGSDELPSVAGGGGHVGGAGLLAEAERIVAHARIAKYSHTTVVDEAQGRFELDCSGFVDYALARVAPDALAPLRATANKRPLAKDFVAYFGALPDAPGRWRRVRRASDLVPGDIVAWSRPVDVASKNTGHVMIVRAAVAAGRGEVAVPIVDSTSMRHGSDDSRFATKATGVGYGTVHVLVDTAGSPVGYRWSNGKKARNHETHVALARLE